MTGLKNDDGLPTEEIEFLSTVLFDMGEKNCSGIKVYR